MMVVILPCTSFTSCANKPGKSRGDKGAGECVSSGVYKERF